MSKTRARFMFYLHFWGGNTLNDKLKFPWFGVTLKYRETRVKGTSHIYKYIKSHTERQHIQRVVLTKRLP